MQRHGAVTDPPLWCQYSDLHLQREDAVFRVLGIGLRRSRGVCGRYSPYTDRPFLSPQLTSGSGGGRGEVRRSFIGGGYSKTWVMSMERIRKCLGG